MTFRQFYSALYLLVLLTPTAQAFDANRTGFQLTLGAGVHSTDIEPTGADGGISTSETQMAFAFNIGYGFTPRFAMTLGGVRSVLSISGQGYTSSLAGVGARYYISPNAPSLFLTGIVGNSVLNRNGNSLDSGPSGSGWLLGVGYEMFEHVQFTGSYVQSDVTDPGDDRIKNEIDTFLFTVEYNWY